MVMARKSYSKKGRNLEPAVMTLTFATPDTVGGAYTLDLSQAASIANRRFYRQGINWAVASVKVLSASPGVVHVDKLPTTWVMANAWKKAFNAWMKRTREAVSESQSVVGRFYDFKIYADSLHHQAGFGANLLPLSSLGLGTTTAGEWIPAEIAIDPTGLTAAEFEIKAVGGNYGGVGASGKQAVSLIDGYATSRALPSESDPNVPAQSDDIDSGTPENWLQGMFVENSANDENIINQVVLYDQPPYPFEGDGIHTDTQYPGGPNQMPGLETHDVVQLVSYSGANNIGTQIIKGGNFPCGLMRFRWAPSESANLAIQVNLIPGNHRGYLCEPMGDM